MTEKIFVSACLLGQPVRYNGKDVPTDSAILQQWQNEGRVISLCPEVAAGLPIPRPPAEIQQGNGFAVLKEQAHVMTTCGQTLTEYFIEGAELALSLCQQYNIRVAVLTEFSPSCGSQMIYNGQFSGEKIHGSGVTAALLKQHSIHVYNQHQLAQAERYLSESLTRE